MSASGSLQRASKRLVRRLPDRPGALDTAVFVFPLFLLYQIGILAGGAGRNGADLVTTLLIELCSRDPGRYLLLLGLLLAGYAALLFGLRRSGRFHPRSFVPMLVESSVYALAMGSLILLVIHYVLFFLPGLAAGELPVARGPVEIAVISAGAGLHEELIFRVGLMGGLTALLARRPGARWGSSFAIALAVSSVLFAAVHHLGPAGEPFTGVAFVYRSLAGAYFGVVYQLRGFAVAAWTHALYDVYVLTFG